MFKQRDLRLAYAQESDLPRIVDLYQSVIDSVAGTEYDVCWELGSRPTFEELESAISAHEMLLCVEATHSDKEEQTLVGAAVINNRQAQGYEQVVWKQDAAPQEVFCLHLFCVSPQHAGKGVGSQFLQMVLDEAQQRGAKSMRLDVLPNNIPAQKLYRKNGFIDHGLFHLFYGEGLLTDFYLMEKVLD